jgi:hypothetical protein
LAAQSLVEDIVKVKWAFPMGRPEDRVAGVVHRGDQREDHHDGPELLSKPVASLIFL